MSEAASRPHSLVSPVTTVTHSLSRHEVVGGVGCDATGRREERSGLAVRAAHQQKSREITTKIRINSKKCFTIRFFA